jgi:hypothetical protein
MQIDWQLSKEDWIERVRQSLVPALLADHRFPDAANLVGRFDASVDQWKRSGMFRPVINEGNELGAAASILTHLTAADRLRYEPRLSSTPKTIDFLVELQDGTRAWIDMKTVAPTWQDDDAAWERLTRIAADFPANASLVVDRHFCGAAIGGHLLKARWTFVQRAVELEHKITLLSQQEQGRVRLLLCSDGSWHEDDLEDFADFYRTGKFRDDDWAQNAIARYMSDEGIAFARTIVGFCYLERRHDEVEPCRFTIDVRGPTLFGASA